MTVAERIELAFRAGYSAGGSNGRPGFSEAWRVYRLTHNMSEPGTVTCPNCLHPSADPAPNTCTEGSQQ